jgi:hypothetical protein
MNLKTDKKSLAILLKKAAALRRDGKNTESVREDIEWLLLDGGLNIPDEVISAVIRAVETAVGATTEQLSYSDVANQLLHYVSKARSKKSALRKKS